MGVLAIGCQLMEALRIRQLFSPWLFCAFIVKVDFARRDSILNRDEGSVFHRCGWWVTKTRRRYVVVWSLVA